VADTGEFDVRVARSGILQDLHQFIRVANLLGHHGGHLVGGLDATRAVGFEPDLLLALDATHQEEREKNRKESEETHAQEGRIAGEGQMSVALVVGIEGWLEK
jgi:hypothetical protein